MRSVGRWSPCHPWRRSSRGASHPTGLRRQSLNLAGVHHSARESRSASNALTVSSRTDCFQRPNTRRRDAESSPRYDIPTISVSRRCGRDSLVASARPPLHWQSLHGFCIEHLRCCHHFPCFDGDEISWAIPPRNRVAHRLPALSRSSGMIARARRSTSTGSSNHLSQGRHMSTV